MHVEHGLGRLVQRPRAPRARRGPAIRRGQRAAAARLRSRRRGRRTVRRRASARPRGPGGRRAARATSVQKGRYPGGVACRHGPRGSTAQGTRRVPARRVRDVRDDVLDAGDPARALATTSTSARRGRALVSVVVLAVALGGVGVGAALGSDRTAAVDPAGEPAARAADDRSSRSRRPSTVLLAAGSCRGSACRACSSSVRPYVVETFVPRIGARAMGWYVAALVPAGWSVGSAWRSRPARVGWRVAFAVLAAAPARGAVVAMRAVSPMAPTARTQPAAAARRDPAARRRDGRRRSAVLRLRRDVHVRPLPARGTALLVLAGRRRASSSSSGGRVAGPVFGPAADRIGWRRVAAGAVALSAVGVASPLPDTLSVLVLGLACVAAAMFAGYTATQLGVGDVARTDRGAASALYFSVYYASGALGAYLPVSRGSVGVGGGLASRAPRRRVSAVARAFARRAAAPVAVDVGASATYAPRRCPARSRGRRPLADRLDGRVVARARRGAPRVVRLLSDASGCTPASSTSLEDGHAARAARRAAAVRAAGRQGRARARRGPRVVGDRARRAGVHPRQRPRRPAGEVRARSSRRSASSRSSPCRSSDAAATAIGAITRAHGGAARVHRRRGRLRRHVARRSSPARSRTRVSTRRRACGSASSSG